MCTCVVRIYIVMPFDMICQLKEFMMRAKCQLHLNGEPHL